MRRVFLALCLGLAGCFVSDVALIPEAELRFPLPDRAVITAFARSDADPTRFDAEDSPVTLTRSARGYEHDEGWIAFADVEPGGEFLVIQQTGEDAEEGFGYALGRRIEDKLYIASVSCEALSMDSRIILGFSAEGGTCRATNLSQIRQAFRALAHSQSFDSYWLIGE